MCFFLYLCSYFRNPVQDFNRTFPRECLGQTYPDPAPITSVCLRASPSNPYNFDPSWPVGYTNITSLDFFLSDLSSYFTSDPLQYHILSDEASVELSSLDVYWSVMEFKVARYMIVQAQTSFGFVQDMMIVVLTSEREAGEVYFQIQSQLRVGLKDYGENTQNVKSMLSFLSGKYHPIKGYP